jgi:hypothetical protein
MDWVDSFIDFAEDKESDASLFWLSCEFENNEGES